MAIRGRWFGAVSRKLCEPRGRFTDPENKGNSSVMCWLRGGIACVSAGTPVGICYFSGQEPVWFPAQPRPRRNAESSRQSRTTASTRRRPPMPSIPPGRPATPLTKGSGPRRVTSRGGAPTPGGADDVPRGRRPHCRILPRESRYNRVFRGKNLLHRNLRVPDECP